MSQPKRIQRKRTKGWTLPPNTVIVDHTSKWGNPFMAVPVSHGYYRVKNKETDKLSDARFRTIRLALIASIDHNRDFIERRVSKGELPINELRGKDLACFCRLDEPCHADVLLELANQ